MTSSAMTNIMPCCRTPAAEARRSLHSVRREADHGAEPVARHPGRDKPGPNTNRVPQMQVRHFEVPASSCSRSEVRRRSGSGSGSWQCRSRARRRRVLQRCAETPRKNPRKTPRPSGADDDDIGGSDARLRRRRRHSKDSRRGRVAMRSASVTGSISPRRRNTSPAAVLRRTASRSSRNIRRTDLFMGSTVEQLEPRLGSGLGRSSG